MDEDGFGGALAIPVWWRVGPFDEAAKALQKTSFSRIAWHRWEKFGWNVRRLPRLGCAAPSCGQQQMKAMTN